MKLGVAQMDSKIWKPGGGGGGGGGIVQIYQKYDYCSIYIYFKHDIFQIHFFYIIFYILSP